MTLYEELQNRKNSGEVLEFNSLSREELKQIWFEEHYKDEYIAELFNVTPYIINKKRRELKLMWKDCIWESCIEQSEFKEMLNKYMLQNNCNVNDVRNLMLNQKVR
jgi:hypothetical protein